MKKIILILVLFTAMFSTILYSQPTWFLQNSGYNTSGALTDVYFINQNTGWICGQSGMISKTSNGGANWITIQNDNNNHNSIYFLNNNTGWVTDNSYLVLLKTTNNGVNWVSINIQNQYPADIYFINENTGWVSSLYNNVLKTTNGGINWNSFVLPGNIPYEFHSLSFANAETGWCSGDYYNFYTNEHFYSIIKTTNGGDNWFFIRVETQPPDRSYGEIQFLNSQTGYLNRIPPSKTTDGGQSWFNILDSSLYTEMYFIDVNTGWFTLGGNITKTTNGGLNWQTQVITNSFITHKIFFIDQYTGWTVGLNNISQNKVLKTTTGGITFINPISTETPSKYSLSQNYPNPFNPTTNIKFSIVNTGEVKLVVYDIQGREVRTLVNESLKPGTYEAAFDARHGGSSSLNSGVYFYKLVVRHGGSSTGNFTETKKMLLIK
ncbi:MAG: YCF48-related protein [Ignavibacteria bacterium]